MSSTRAEFCAILEGLHGVLTLGKDVFFFVDSQGDLYELLPASPCGCDIMDANLKTRDALLWWPCAFQTWSYFRGEVKELHFEHVGLMDGQTDAGTRF